MRSTFKILFFLKRDKQKTNGMIPLYCRITVDGNEVRFGMKCDVNPKVWDVKTGKAIGRSSEATQINTLVDATNAAIHKIYRELQERDNYVTAEKIKNVFLGIEQKQQTLLELFDWHNKERKSQIGINFCESSYKKYCNTRRYVANFLMYKYNLSDIPVKELNKQFIVDFETWLLTMAFSKNYVNTLLKNLRRIIKLALEREWIYRNPFTGHKLQWQKVDRGYLTQTEIDTLINFQFEKKILEKARDIFIFCTFTGLSYTDAQHLTYDNIKSSFDGKLWIKGKRQKTDTEYNIPLLNIPNIILENYKEKTSGDSVLPFIEIGQYNRLLKRVAKACGISKRISSHLARHTFATLALTQGVSIESVSKMLGHTNINTTQIYAKITNKKIGNEMNLLAGNIKRWDKKSQLPTDQEEISIERVLKSFKIPTGKAADVLWESLISKVWSRLSNIYRETFVSEVNNKETKPSTLRDFYVLLIDYFLENTGNYRGYNYDFPENDNVNTQVAINF